MTAGASRPRLAVVLVLVATALCTPTFTTVATATSLRALTLDELVQASALIMHARVVNASERVRRIDGQLLPFTTARFEVVEALRGWAQPLSIEGPVGRRGDGRVREIVGWPRFIASEEVVLFLEARGGRFSPVGMGQGIFRVQRTARGDAVCHRVLEDVEIIGDTAIPERLPLEDLRAAVLALGNTP